MLFIWAYSNGTSAVESVDTSHAVSPYLRDGELHCRRVSTEHRNRIVDGARDVHLVSIWADDY